MPNAVNTCKNTNRSSSSLSVGVSRKTPIKRSAGNQQVQANPEQTQVMVNKIKQSVLQITNTVNQTTTTRRENMNVNKICASSTSSGYRFNGGRASTGAFTDQTNTNSFSFSKQVNPRKTLNFNSQNTRDALTPNASNSKKNNFQLSYSS